MKVTKKIITIPHKLAKTFELISSLSFEINIVLFLTRNLQRVWEKYLTCKYLLKIIIAELIEIQMSKLKANNKFKRFYTNIDTLSI